MSFLVNQDGYSVEHMFPEISTSVVKFAEHLSQSTAKRRFQQVQANCCISVDILPHYYASHFRKVWLQTLPQIEDLNHKKQ